MNKGEGLNLQRNHRVSGFIPTKPGKGEKIFRKKEEKTNKVRGRLTEEKRQGGKGREALLKLATFRRPAFADPKVLSKCLAFRIVQNSVERDGEAKINHFTFPPYQ